MADGALTKRDKLAAALTSQVLKVVDEGVGPLTGSREYAEARLKQQNGDVESAITRIVRETIASSGAAGFTTGLGGFITLPLSLPANITGQAILNARMVAAIAHLRGWDLSDELVRNGVLITLAGGSPNAVLSKFGVQLGQRFAEQAIRRVPVTVVREINRRVGFMLLAKYGTERSVLTMAKAVPFAGGVVGGAVDATFSKGISTIAKRSFPRVEDVGSTGEVAITPAPASS